MLVGEMADGREGRWLGGGGSEEGGVGREGCRFRGEMDARCGDGGGGKPDDSVLEREEGVWVRWDGGGG